MKTVEITLFKFSELSEKAKQKALDHFKNSSFDAFGWQSECRNSIVKFCEHYDVNLVSWSVGPYSPIEYKHDANDANFRGLKLSAVSRDMTLTGYCLDYTLSYTFHDEFKKTGNAVHAFDAAVCAAFREWRNDWENANSDESLSEFVESNDYHFLETGKLYEGA